MESHFKLYHKMPIRELIKEYKNCDPHNEAKKIILNKIIKEKIDIINKNKQEFNNNLNDMINSRKQKESDNKKEKHTQVDQRFKQHLEHDFKNNKLMERLNIELDFRVNGIDEKSIVKPYADVDCGDFVSVKDFDSSSIPKNNFSSRRLAE